MRNVIFIANGKQFSTMKEAEKENPHFTMELSPNYNGEGIEVKKVNQFGVFTGKLAEGWKAPYQRV